MSDLARDIWSLIRGTPEATDVVPSRGISAWLIVTTSAAITFLAVLAIAFSLAMNRLSDRWGEELASSLTIRISAPLAQRKAQTEATLNILKSTPGVVSARIVTNDEQSTLLEPWLGTGIDLERFSLPILIAVEETAEGPDRQGLTLRLEAEAPGAVIDDHGAWRIPMIKSAENARDLGVAIVALVFVTLVALVVLAVQAAIVSNAQNISTMRLIGARDTFIVRAFVRRITLRSGAGAAIGALIASCVILLIAADQDSPFSLSFSGREWLYPILIIPFVASVAFFATRFSGFLALKDMR